jgi:hypothetical protein
MIRLLLALAAHVMHRSPDFVIGGHDDPYMLRWWVIPRNRLFNVYLHEFHRSDDDRALHDHPWWNCSVLIAGRYIEHTIRAGGVEQQVVRNPGAMVFRRARAAHRISLLPGETCRTLFITGPRLREWGFHCRRGWVHWKKFTSTNDSGAIGAGCDGATE